MKWRGSAALPCRAGTGAAGGHAGVSNAGELIGDDRQAVDGGGGLEEAGVDCSFGVSVGQRGERGAGKGAAAPFPAQRCSDPERAFQRSVSVGLQRLRAGAARVSDFGAGVCDGEGKRSRRLQFPWRKFKLSAQIRGLRSRQGCPHGPQ